MDSGPSFKIYVSNYPHLHNGLIYIFLKKIFLKRNRLWNSQQSRSFRQIEKITLKFYLWTGVTVNGFSSLSHFQTWDIQMSAPFWPAIQLQYPHWPLVIRPPCSSCTSIDSLARCAFFSSIYDGPLSIHVFSALQHSSTALSPLWQAILDECVCR